MTQFGLFEEPDVGNDSSVSAVFQVAFLSGNLAMFDRAGQRYTIDRSGLVIVATQAESRIALYSPGIGAPPIYVERSDQRAVNDCMIAHDC